MVATIHSKASLLFAEQVLMVFSSGILKDLIIPFQTI